MDYTVSDSMIEMSVSILNSYGDLLMDIICKDACSGHDITKVGGKIFSLAVNVVYHLIK